MEAGIRGGGSVTIGMCNSENLGPQQSKDLKWRTPNQGSGGDTIHATSWVHYDGTEMRASVGIQILRASEGVGSG